MDPATFALISSWAERASIISMLLVIVIAVVKGYWVPGYEYRHRVEERDKAIASLATSVETAKVLAESNERLTQQCEKLTAGWRPPRG